MEMNHRHLHTLTGSLSNLERFSTSDIWNPDSAPADFRKAGLRPARRLRAQWFILPESGLRQVHNTAL